MIESATMRPHLVLATGLSLMLSLSFPQSRATSLTGADPYSEETELARSEGQVDDWFGVSVSMSSNGKNAVVGSVGDKVTGGFAGGAYVYRRKAGTWVEQAKITPEDISDNDQVGDYFARSVAISGNAKTVVAGATKSVYVFRRKGRKWLQTARLRGPWSFGQTVGIDKQGQIIAAGAEEANDSRGIVKLFQLKGGEWVQEANLSARDAKPGDVFGTSVSVSANTIVVGARGVDDFVFFGGAAYVFQRKGEKWVQQAKLTASIPSERALFGYSVSISDDGNTLVVGAYYGEFRDGAAYVFSREGKQWVETAKLLGSRPGVIDQFGQSVAIRGDGNLIAVGAGDDAFGDRHGAVYVFRRIGEEWVEQAMLTASNATRFHAFGAAVAIGRRTILVGANHAFVNGVSDFGRAYVYE